MMESPFMVKGSFVLVSFPFENQNIKKVRPAICLSNPIGEHRHIIVAFISSRIPIKVDIGDIHFKKEDIGFDISGLKVDSVIKTYKLISIPENLIIRRIGKAGIDLTNQIENNLKSILF